MDGTLKTALDALLYSEILAAVAAAIFYKKIIHTPIKYLIVILWLIVLTEQLGSYMAEKRVWLYKDTYSYWLYNIMFPIWKIIYLYIFYRIIKNNLYKVWIKRFMFTLMLAVPINWIFLQDFLTEIESYSYILGSIFLVISALFYLLELLRSEKVIIYHRKIMFWISIGLLIFYSGTIPFILSRDFYSNLEYTHNLFLIIYVLGTLLYTIITFGFIWSKKE